MKNKAGAVILNFFLRAVMGICLIYFINQYVLPDQDSWKVGINGLSFLTSGSLGIPGVCMLYGILVYQSLLGFHKKLQFRKSVWTRRETAFIIHFTQQIIRVLFLSDLLHRSFVSGDQRILIVSYFYSGCGSQRYLHPKD